MRDLEVTNTDKVGVVGPAPLPFLWMAGRVERERMRHQGARGWRLHGGANAPCTTSAYASGSAARASFGAHAGYMSCAPDAIVEGWIVGRLHSLRYGEGVLG